MHAVCVWNLRSRQLRVWRIEGRAALHDDPASPDDTLLGEEKA